MRLKSYINERKSVYGPGITFMDIDSTILDTSAKVVIRKDGKEVKRLNNYGYLHYTPEEGEVADFSEYTDAEFFRKTSKPIVPVVNRIKRMFNNIKERGSRIVIVTARASSNNKEEFLQTFRDMGIPIDDIYIERTGKEGESSSNIPADKKKVMFKYLNTGLYRRARLIDDSKQNCLSFLELQNELPDATIKKIREKYNIPEDEPPIDFYALQVMKDGSLQRVG